MYSDRDMDRDRRMERDPLPPPRHTEMERGESRYRRPAERRPPYGKPPLPNSRDYSDDAADRRPRSPPRVKTKEELEEEAAVAEFEAGMNAYSASVTSYHQLAKKHNSGRDPMPPLPPEWDMTRREREIEEEKEDREREASKHWPSLRDGLQAASASRGSHTPPAGQEREEKGKQEKEKDPSSSSSSTSDPKPPKNTPITKTPQLQGQSGRGSQTGASSSKEKPVELLPKVNMPELGTLDGRLKEKERHKMEADSAAGSKREKGSVSVKKENASVKEEKTSERPTTSDSSKPSRLKEAAPLSSQNGPRIPPLPRMSNPEAQKAAEADYYFSMQKRHQEDQAELTKRQETDLASFLSQARETDDAYSLAVHSITVGRMPCPHLFKAATEVVLQKQRAGILAADPEPFEHLLLQSHQQCMQQGAAQTNMGAPPFFFAPPAPNGMNRQVPSGGENRGVPNGVDHPGVNVNGVPPPAPPLGGLPMVPFEMQQAFVQQQALLAMVGQNPQYLHELQLQEPPAQGNMHMQQQQPGGGQTDSFPHPHMFPRAFAPGSPFFEGGGGGDGSGIMPGPSGAFPPHFAGGLHPGP
mmetsp:Transcript_29026/g.56835  ORF Transcript_29026/g.56835 Transcript_29026/m.56835 type:complete len:584 (-) Transcript_29026:291-2042(-)